MIPIYMNIDGLYSMSGEQVILNCADTQGKDFIIYTFNKKQKKFMPQN